MLEDVLCGARQALAMLLQASSLWPELVLYLIPGAVVVASLKITRLYFGMSSMPEGGGAQGHPHKKNVPLDWKLVSLLGTCVQPLW